MKKRIVYNIEEFFPCSIFETLRSYDGRIFKLDEHISRLKGSAKTAGIELTKKETEGFKELIISNYNKAHIKNAYIRFALSVPDKKTNLIIKEIKTTPDEFYKKGVCLKTSVEKRPSELAFKYNAKSSNFLSGIFAKADTAGAFDAVILNDKGYVAESTVANIFMIKKGVIFTPLLSTGLLEGVTRQIVIDLVKKNDLKISETNFSRHDLYNADECFLTSTTTGILPVVEIDKRAIASGKPGEITIKLIKKFSELVK